MTLCLFGVLRISPRGDLQKAATRLLGHASASGFGIRIGLQSIPILGDDDKEELRILSALLEESGTAIPFELLSTPLDDNIETVFESEFNPPWDVDSGKSRVVSLLRDIWSEPDSMGLFCVVYEKPGPSLEQLSRWRVTFDELVVRLSEYYAKSGLPGSAGCDGIYEVLKTEVA